MKRLSCPDDRGAVPWIYDFANTGEYFLSVNRAMLTISVPIRFPTARSVALAPKQSNSFLPSAARQKFLISFKSLTVVFSPLPPAPLLKKLATDGKFAAHLH